MRGNLAATRGVLLASALAAGLITSACGGGGQQLMISGTYCGESSASPPGQVQVEGPDHTVLGSANMHYVSGAVVGFTGLMQYRFHLQVPRENSYIFIVQGVHGSYVAGAKEAEHVALTDGNC